MEYNLTFGEASNSTGYYNVRYLSMMLFSVLRITCCTTCAILTAKSNNLYGWFSPLFTAEASYQTLLFIFEFVNNFYADYLVTIFCNFLVTELHYMSSSMIFLYMWAVSFFLFQEFQYTTNPFAFLIFSLLLIASLLASVVDAIVNREDSCKNKEFTGFAKVYMSLAGFAVCLTMIALVGWKACFHQSEIDHPEKNTWFIILFTAVAVRVPGLEVISTHIIDNTSTDIKLVLRILPIIYPVVFMFVTKGKLKSEFLPFSGSEVD